MADINDVMMDCTPAMMTDGDFEFTLDTVQELNFLVGLAIGAGIVTILWILCLSICCCSCLLYRMKRNRTYHIKGIV